MFFTNTLLALAACFSLTHASVIAERSTSGLASTYGGNLDGGACSFTGYTLPANIYGTALGLNLYGTAVQCGACVSITNASGTKITAMIVDECPGGCNGNTFDIFQTGFLEIGTLTQGIIPITWSYITCPITTPFILRTKTGSSQYWFAIQVMNANQAITKVEYSTTGTTWVAMARQTYNYWLQASGTGTATTVQIRVTAANGKQVVTKNVPVIAGSSVTAASNF